jgi:hypothetical protein
MTPLSELEASPAPRRPEVAKRLAETLVPTWGFYAYGVLYFLFFGAWGLMVGGGLTLWILCSAFGFGPKKPMPPLGQAVVVLGALCGVAVTVWPFRQWARSKRVPARRLFETGNLVEGVVEKVTTIHIKGAQVITERLAFQRGAATLYASVSYGGLALLAPGARRQLLVAEGVSLVSAFDAKGRLIAGRIT